MQSITTVLGKLLGPSHQNLQRKVTTFACICVEIDLNMHLHDSVEIRLGNMLWFQQLDYEGLPF